MGIGDDIKPQKDESGSEIKPEEIAEEQNDSALQTENDNHPEEEGRVEIPIDKTGKTPPVYEDIFKDNKAPFEHLEEKKQEINEVDNPKSGKSIDGLPGTTKPKKKSRILRNVILIICILVLAFVVFTNLENIKSLLGFDGAKEIGKEGTSGVEIISGQDYTNVTEGGESVKDGEVKDTPVESTEPENTDAVEPLPTNVEPATETASFDKSTLTIRVLNGNGVNGSAATLADILRADGYTIAEVTNASRFTYQNTTIYYDTDMSEAAEAVKTLLADYSVLTYENPTVVANYDLIVVTGKE